MVCLRFDRTDRVRSVSDEETTQFWRNGTRCLKWFGRELVCDGPEVAGNDGFAVVTVVMGNTLVSA